MIWSRAEQRRCSATTFARTFVRGMVLTILVRPVAYDWLAKQGRRRKGGTRMRPEEEQRIKDYQLGEKLAYLRTMLGVSRSALAKRLRVQESYVTGIETGTNTLGATQLPAYSHALGFDTAILCAIVDEVERTWCEG